MSLSKNLFFLFSCCLIFISFQSCSEDLVEPEVLEAEAISVDARTWPCFHMMNEISWAFADDCAAQTAQDLESMLDNYVDNPSDTTIYQAMFYQIGLWIDLVNCNSEYDCYNCEDYIAQAQAFADCLEDEQSPFAGQLDNIIGTLINACNQCDEDACCDDVSLVVTTTPVGEDGCCFVQVDLIDPESCTDGSGTLYYPKGDAMQPVSLPANFTLCPGYGPVQILVNDCFVEEWTTTGDCEVDPCCDGGISITQEPHPVHEGCCYVYVTDPCGDEFTVELATGVFTYTGSRTFLLCEDETIRVTDEDCYFDSGLIGADCQDCCDDVEINFTQTKVGDCCRVDFTYGGCPDGFFMQVQGNIPVPLSGETLTFHLCNQFQSVRVFHEDCGVDSGWVYSRCKF